MTTTPQPDYYREADPELVPTYYGRDPYTEFLKTEGVPVVEAYSVDCVNMDVEPWPRLGGRGAYVHLAGKGDYLSAYVAEIPPGGQLNVEQHLHDEYIHVVSGRGATTIELPNGKKHTFEWGAGAAFGIPLNAKHQHFNGSGTEPARFAAVTNLLTMINLFHDESFIFDNDRAFPDRVGDERFYRGEGEFQPVRAGQHVWATNLVPDLVTFDLPNWHERGAGGNMINFNFADSPLSSHISEFPMGTYKKAHRHDAGAHIFCVTGKGYSLLWLDGQDPIATTRVDWWPGVLFAPPDGPTNHQHFNIAPSPSRYLVFGFGGRRYPVFQHRKNAYLRADVSQKNGGIQVEYEDEDPRILEYFEKECARNEVTPVMRGYLKERHGISR
jgi:quercetin dioxygenase-like cupin family protein